MRPATVRRGLARRPVLLFGLLLLGPAVGFSLLGWRSVEREREVRRRELERETSEVLARRVRTAVEEIESLRRAEEARPYFEYQDQYVPAELVADNVALQRSSLRRAPSDPRILGWFQWESGRQRTAAPEMLGPWASSGDGLLASYGDALRARLAAASGDLDLRTGREVNVPLWVVKGNEERGQIFEELQIIQSERKGQFRGRQGSPPPQEAQEAAEPQQAVPVQQSLASPYLLNFLDVLGEEKVPIRYAPFRYMARAEGVAGPPLVAWRVVWIPATHAEKRERGGERWLLQGYGLDPGRTLPSTWELDGPARVCRGDCPGVAATGGARATLAHALGADVLPAGATPDPSLTLVAVADADAADQSDRDARQRFFLLVAGLVAVVAVGFGLLLRGVRKEIALARNKEDFVAAVTHELRTPLTGIRMYAEMLREGWATDEAAARSQAQRILDETDRLGTLVDQVLDLAALDRGVARADLRVGDVGAAVRSAVQSMAPRAAEAGVDLSLDAPSDLPPVAFDERLLRPLLLNLLDNAIKYSERAPVKRVIVTLSREADGVLLQVADRGAGIPEELRSRLFEPFQRAGDEMTRSARGVGIGLALVKRYADALGARVAIESALGVGTTVTVRLAA